MANIERVQVTIADEEGFYSMVITLSLITMIMRPLQEQR